MIRIAALELLHVNAFARIRKQYDHLVRQKVRMTFMLDTRRLSPGSPEERGCAGGPTAEFLSGPHTRKSSFHTVSALRRH